MAELEDPYDAPPLRWAILGAGGIAGAFAGAVTRHTRSQVVAVGSRDLQRATRFAGQHDIPRAHGSYEALVADPDIDAVYVATPHSEHRDHALLAIAAGRPVLVEKAFTRDAAAAQEVLAAAGAAGVFAMEAMWTRFLPHMVALRELVAAGGIGEPIGLVADHGQDMRHHPPSHRLHDPALAGGALLDLGVYPVSFAHDLFGVPDRITALGSRTATGVDGQVSLALGFGEVMQASLHTTLWARTATTAVVFGTEGRVELADRFYGPTSFALVRADGDGWTYRDHVVDGLQYEAAEVARCVAAGAQQSSVMGWQATLDVMHTLDEARRQVGVVFPAR